MLRSRCVGDWFFAELKVAGKFPPVTLSRKINAFNESVCTVASSYGVSPYIRVIVVNSATGEEFKMGIVLNYSQQYKRNIVYFGDVKLSVGVESSASKETQLELINAIFDVLHADRPHFMKKMQCFCYDTTKKIVVQQVTQ
jgi:hypothetical protein